MSPKRLRDALLGGQGHVRAVEGVHDDEGIVHAYADEDEGQDALHWRVSELRPHAEAISRNA